MARPPLGALNLVLESVRLLLPNFPRLFPLAFVPGLALVALGRLLEASAGEEEGVGRFLVVLLSSTLVSALAIAIQCLAALDLLGGRRRPVGGYLAVALARSVPLIVLGMIYVGMITAGLMLLVLPGLYLLGRFLPWIAALLYEDAGWKALARAQVLTEGRRWPLAGSALFFLLLAAFVPLPAMVLAEAFGGPAGFLLEATGLSISYMLNGLYVALVYVRLRALEPSPPDRGPWSRGERLS